jgi:methylglyoxal/glyoxal reductase
MRKEGVVKHIGVSNFNRIHLEHMISKSDFIPEMNQFEIHPLCYDKDLIDFCNSKGIIVEAYSPLARNHPDVMKNIYLLELAEKYKRTLP